MLTTSAESNREEVYVRSSPSDSPTRLHREQPNWSPKGDEIYYFDERGRALSVAFDSGPAPIFGRPRVLFEDGGHS